MYVGGMLEAASPERAFLIPTETHLLVARREAAPLENTKHAQRRWVDVIALPAYRLNTFADSRIRGI